MKAVKNTAAAVFGNCVAMTFYGLSFLWTKITYRYCGPFTVIFIRLVLSVALLSLVDAILARSSGRAHIRRRPGGKDLVRIGLLSLFVPFLYFVGENLGLMGVSPGVAASIIALIPVATPLMSRVFLEEKISLMTVAGMILSLSGVLIMVGEGLYTASATAVGAALVFLAVLASSAGAIVVRRLPSSLPGLTIVKYQNLLGAVLFLPLFLIFEAKGIARIRPEPELLWSLAALAALPSTVSYLLYNHAIRVLGPARASAFSNAVPVIAAVFSALVLGEGFGAVKLLGMAMVVGGVALSQVRGGPRAEAAA